MLLIKLLTLFELSLLRILLFLHFCPFPTLLWSISIGPSPDTLLFTLCLQSLRLKANLWEFPLSGSNISTLTSLLQLFERISKITTSCPQNLLFWALKVCFTQCFRSIAFCTQDYHPEYISDFSLRPYLHKFWLVKKI